MPPPAADRAAVRSEEHPSELQSPCNLVCRLLLEKKTRNNHEGVAVLDEGPAGALIVALGGKPVVRLARAAVGAAQEDAGAVVRTGFFFFLRMGVPPTSPLFPHGVLFI